MNTEVLRVAVKLFLGAITVAFGGNLIEHGTKDALKLKRRNNG